MLNRTWVHRLLSPLVKLLIGTPVSPNHLTTLRLATGLFAMGCFASGAINQGGLLFVVSTALDHMDGELARLTGKTSRAGHYYDLIADFFVYLLLFPCIGVGLHEQAGDYGTIINGIIAGVFVGLIFWQFADEEGPATVNFSTGEKLDPDNLMFIVGPIAWFGWLPEFLMAAVIGAPVAYICLRLYLRFNK